MVFAYGDESMDETKQRVCAVAAVIGTEEHWKAIEEKWMERNRGIPFHAKDCDVNPGRGDYANRTHDENKNLYRDLAIMLAESGLYGAGVAVDIQAQERRVSRCRRFHILSALSAHNRVLAIYGPVKAGHRRDYL